MLVLIQLSKRNGDKDTETKTMIFNLTQHEPAGTQAESVFCPVKGVRVGAVKTDSHGS